MLYLFGSFPEKTSIPTAKEMGGDVVLVKRGAMRHHLLVLFASSSGFLSCSRNCLCLSLR